MFVGKELNHGNKSLFEVRFDYSGWSNTQWGAIKRHCCTILYDYILMGGNWLWHVAKSKIKLKNVPLVISFYRSFDILYIQYYSEKRKTFRTASLIKTSLNILFKALPIYGKYLTIEFTNIFVVLCTNCWQTAMYADSERSSNVHHRTGLSYVNRTHVTCSFSSDYLCVQT